VHKSGSTKTLPEGTVAGEGNYLLRILGIRLQDEAQYSILGGNSVQFV
jgi:hypothetical protein